MRQKVWKNSTMDAWDSDGRCCYKNWPCVVRLEGGTLEIRYQDDPDRETIRYVGGDDNYPDFKVTGFRVSDGVPFGTANLCISEDERFLEGSWIEGNTSGDEWCITLR